MKSKHCRRARRDLALETWQRVDQAVVSFKDHWLHFNEEHQKLQKELANEAKRVRK